jgi:long-subunit fatty acid transport protein
MKQLIFVFFAFLMATVANAGSVYLEGAYNGIWDNLDQGTTDASVGVTFNPYKRFQVDVGGTYVVNDHLSTYEDDWRAGVRARVYVFDF